LGQARPMIAVVDDDASVCRALERLLQSIGMTARTFSSGDEFIEFIEATPSFHPDCVILDLQMRGLNGLGVQARLTQGGGGIPVIFITAYDEIGAREQALAGGAVAFLRKPFSDELLIKALDDAIHGSFGGRSGP